MVMRRRAAGTPLPMDALKLVLEFWPYNPMCVQRELHGTAALVYY